MMLSFITSPFPFKRVNPAVTCRRTWTFSAKPPSDQEPSTPFSSLESGSPLSDSKLSISFSGSEFPTQIPQATFKPLPVSKPRNGARKPTDWANRSRRPRVTHTFSEEQIISRIVGCTRRDNWYLAHVAFREYAHQAEPTPRLVAAYVHALSRGGRVDAAKAVLLQSAHADSPFARASLIAAIAKQNGSEAALSELYALPSRLWSPHACTAVIHALGIEMRADDAVLLLRAAQRNGVLVDMEMYNAGLRALGRAGLVRDSFQLLAEVNERGLKLNDITFEALIYACAHARVGIQASSLVDLGRRACILYDAAIAKDCLSPRVLSAFSSVLLRAGLWEDPRVDSLILQMQKALSLSVNEMKRYGIAYDRFIGKLQRLMILRERKGCIDEHTESF